MKRVQTENSSRAGDKFFGLQATFKIKWLSQNDLPTIEMLNIFIYIYWVYFNLHNNMSSYLVHLCLSFLEPYFSRAKFEDVNSVIRSLE